MEYSLVTVSNESFKDLESFIVIMYPNLFSVSNQTLCEG